MQVKVAFADTRRARISVEVRKPKWQEYIHY